MLLESVPPPEKRLKLSDTFVFSCQRELACFNTCCRNKDLMLAPYDILRLKKALNVHSDKLLEQYGLYRVDPVSGFPVISLGMSRDDRKICPFVSREGCSVYMHRPTACRLYPLGRASAAGQGGGAQEEFFFLLDTPHCLGIKEQRILNLKEWIESQGLTPYLENNSRMLELIFHPARGGRGPLDEGRLQKVIVACYNLDVFRDFIFTTRFLDHYAIDEKTRSRIEKDDEALLAFGFDYLRQTLFP